MADMACLGHCFYTLETGEGRERETQREREIGAEHAIGVIRALGIRGKLVGESGEYGPMSEDGNEIPRLRINDGIFF